MPPGVFILQIPLPTTLSHTYGPLSRARRKLSLGPRR